MCKEQGVKINVKKYASRNKKQQRVISNFVTTQLRQQQHKYFFFAPQKCKQNAKSTWNETQQANRRLVLQASKASESALKRAPTTTNHH